MLLPKPWPNCILGSSDRFHEQNLLMSVALLFCYLNNNTNGLCLERDVVLGGKMFYMAFEYNSFELFSAKSSKDHLLTLIILIWSSVTIGLFNSEVQWF